MNTSSTRSARRVLLILLGVAAFFAISLGIIGAWLTYWPPTNKMTVPKAERLMNDHFPPGAPREEVEGWLAANGVKYASGPGAGFIRLDQLPKGLSQSQIGCTGEAIYPNAWVDPLFSGAVIIEFFFDKNDKLLKYQITTRVAMP